MPLEPSIHISVSPLSLGYRYAQDVESGCCQAFVFGVDIPYLEPDHQRAAPGAIGLPGDFQQALAEEEHQAGRVLGAEFTVDSQAQHVAVELVAPVQVYGAQQDAAAQDVHTTILAGWLW